MMHRITIDNARRVYRARKGTDRVALDGVSLTIEPGSWVTLLGPNGSGKSTLMRLIALQDTPDAGKVTHVVSDAGSASVRAASGSERSSQPDGGQPARSHSRLVPDPRALIGVVFQTPALDELLTGRENLVTTAALFGSDAHAARVRIDEFAAELGVADRLDDRVSALSGGLRRRVDLARALLHEPSVVLLDEPTTGLDPTARADLLGLIDAIHRDRGVTIISATHLLDEAEHADRVVLMHEGRVVRDGTPGELRAELGRRMLTVTGRGDACAGILNDAGVHPEQLGSTLVVRPFTGDGVLIDRLVETGAEVRVGPPTLGDVYADATGRAIDDMEVRA